MNVFTDVIVILLIVCCTFICYLFLGKSGALKKYLKNLPHPQIESGHCQRSKIQTKPITEVTKWRFCNGFEGRDYAGVYIYQYV